MPVGSQVDGSKYPTLARLLREGYLWIALLQGEKRSQYVGITKDMYESFTGFGYVGEEEAVEQFISNEHPPLEAWLNNHV